MRGTAWKFGNDIDTDIIVPGRYLIYTDEEILSKFDEIIVMKNGNIVEFGTYQDLMNNNATFKSLVELC